MPGASGNVVVAVRTRPLNTRELQEKAKCIVRIEKDQILITPPTSKDKNGRPSLESSPKIFRFDFSYDSIDPHGSEYVGQNRLYLDLGESLLSRAFDGYNCCIFAYGQTGSGKSYSMMGNPEDKGIIPAIALNIFKRIESCKDSSIVFQVECSYLEIYNERVRDLLAPKSAKSLRVREHPATGPYVENLSKLLVESYTDIQTLMDTGNRSRTTASTAMNESSSRSHAVFSILLTQRRSASEMETEIVSKISLVDLAGSERVHTTGAVGTRLKEGAEINKSLSTLGRVISALATNSHRRHSSQIIKVPYRDSILTWLLKDSLGGNSMTAMLATISPAETNFEETLSTLRYADSAKRIRNHAIVNEDQNTKVIRELREELAILRVRLARGPGTLADHLPQAGVSRLVSDSSSKLMTEDEVAERIKQSEAIMQEVNQSWQEKLANTQRIQREKETALGELGIQIEDNSVGVRTPQRIPHLVNLSEDPLFTEHLIYYLKPGMTTCGNLENSAADIQLSGNSIFYDHCTFTNTHGTVLIRPTAHANVMVNGLRLTASKRLKSGYRIILGDEGAQAFRFNHPEEYRAERDLLSSPSPSRPPTRLNTSSRSSLIIGDLPLSELDGWRQENTYDHGDFPAVTTISTQPLVIEQPFLDPNGVNESNDAAFGKVFENLHKQRSYGRDDQSRSPRPLSDDVPDLDESSLNTRDRFSSSSSTEPLESSPLRNHEVQYCRSSPSTEAHDAMDRISEQRKRASDTESIMQMLNANRLIAESRGHLEPTSVIERMIAARVEAEQKWQLQQTKVQHKEPTLKSSDSISNVESVARLSRQVLTKWRLCRSVAMCRDLLHHNARLREAQAWAARLGIFWRFQFSIWSESGAPISPLESDEVYELFNNDLCTDNRPRVVIQVMDLDKNIVFLWSVSKLEHKLNNLAERSGWSTENARLAKMSFVERPLPVYTFLGQAVMPLLTAADPAERSFDIDIFSAHTFLHTATLRVSIKVSESAIDEYIVELRIESIMGLSEKEATDIHIHAFFMRNPERRLTTKMVSGFDEANINFRSKHMCNLQHSDLPDSLQFQIYGQAQPAFLQKLRSWDELQESRQNPPDKVLLRSRSVLIHTMISELDATGSYVPVESLSTDKDPGFFYIHQGLSRRFGISILMESLQPTRYKILSVGINNVKSVDVRTNSTISETSELVDLRIISGASQLWSSSSNLSLQWDSSAHNTSILDRTTPMDQLVIVQLIVVMTTVDDENVSISCELPLRVHGRDTHPGWLSRLFAGYRSSNSLSSLVSIPMDLCGAKFDTIRQHQKVYQSESTQEELRDWSPRGSSLVEGFYRMLKTQSRSLNVQSLHMRYSRSQLSMAGHVFNPLISEHSLLIRKIVQFWTDSVRVSLSTDLQSRVRSTYTEPALRIVQLEAIHLQRTILFKSYLHVRAAGTNDSSWLKLYYVLRDSVLLEFTNPQQQAPQSFLNLSNCTSIGAADLGSRHNVFQIIKGDLITYYQADSEDSYNKWIGFISSVIAH